MNKLLGINWRTTILGIGVIVAASGRIAIAYRTRDFESLANDGQLIAETLAMILGGLGLFIAKDSSVSGVGTEAVTLDSAGTLKNVEGEKVGEQAPAK